MVDSDVFGLNMVSRAFGAIHVTMMAPMWQETGIPLINLISRMVRQSIFLFFLVASAVGIAKRS